MRPARTEGRARARLIAAHQSSYEIHMQIIWKDPPVFTFHATPLDRRDPAPNTRPMKPLYALAALAFLAACSEQDLCVYRNTQDLRAAERRIAELEANIARGYAIHISQERYTYEGVCYKEGKNGKPVPYACLKHDWREVEKPVAINVGEERRKLAALKTALPALQARTNEAIAQCQTLYPE